MNDVVSFLKSDEALCVYGIMLVISVIYIIFRYLKKTKSARLKKQNTAELNKIVKEISKEERKNTKVVEKKAKVKEISKEKTKSEIQNVKSLDKPVDTFDAPVVSPIENEVMLSKSAHNIVNTMEIEEAKESNNIDVPVIAVPAPVADEIIPKIEQSVLTEKSREIPKQIVKEISKVEDDLSLKSIRKTAGYQKTIKELKANLKEQVFTNKVASISVNQPVVEEVSKKTSRMSRLDKEKRLDLILGKIYQNENQMVAPVVVHEEKQLEEQVDVIAIEEIKEELPTIKIESLEEEVVPVVQEEEIVYTNIVPNEEEAKRELEEVTKKLKEEECNNKVITLTEFEQMQEDNAIISLDELMKKAGTLYEQNEQIQYKDEGNEPISLADLERRKVEMMGVSSQEVANSNNDTINSIEANIEKLNSMNAFSSGSVLSPIYGIKTNNINANTDIELENTANYQKLDDEIRKTNDFISSLKELQKKLD